MTAPEFVLLDSEWAALCGLPDEDVLALTAELDLVAPAGRWSAGEAAVVVVACVHRYRRLGFPLTRYDAEDVAALPELDRRALATLVGVPAEASMASWVAAGGRAWRAAERRGDRTLVLASLLMPIIARAARSLP